MKEKVTDNDKLFAFLATLLSIVGFIFVLVSKKESKYVKFYAKQSLVVFVVLVILSILGQLFFLIGPVGFIIGAILHLISFALWLFSWVYALTGEMREVPFIGQYAREFKI